MKNWERKKKEVTTVEKDNVIVSVNGVDCVLCGNPQSYVVRTPTIWKTVSSTMRRITTKKSKEKLYAHEYCYQKAKQEGQL